MCEIFPEVDNCCFVCSVRVGMLLIAILSITSGGLGLCVVEQRTQIGYNKVLDMYQNATHIQSTKQALSQLSDFISTAVSGLSLMFVIAGLLLLFATLTDQEGVAQMFVWIVFLNIVVGGILVLSIGFECVMQSRCLLGNMDWLSAATTLIMMVFYLVMWFYFVCVANSYVLNGYT